MNKRSVKKARPAKSSRSASVRKSPVRKSSARRARSKKPEARPARRPQTNGVPAAIAVVTVAQIAHVSGLGDADQTHKYQVGQTVFYTSSPISRPGANGSYKVVRLLPSDGEDYQYRIKNPGEAFERVAKESQLELDR